MLSSGAESNLASIQQEAEHLLSVGVQAAQSAEGSAAHAFTSAEQHLANALEHPSILASDISAMEASAQATMASFAAEIESGYKSVIHEVASGMMQPSTVEHAVESAVAE